MGDDGQFVQVERGDDGVAVLRLDRPKANALSGEVLRQLAAAAQTLIDDPPGAVVVTGGERIFAAGADIAEFTTDGVGQLIEPAGARTISETFRQALDAVAAIPRMTVAAIAGYALGGGCELALACDIRIAADTAKLGQPEVLLGIMPGGGGTQRLARLVGPSKAKDLICSGRQVRADEALRIGLVDEIVAPDLLAGRAHEVAAGFAKGAVAAQALAKIAIDRGLDEELAGGLTIETELFAESFTHADAATGVRSFLKDGPGRAQFSGQ